MTAPSSASSHASPAHCIFVIHSVEPYCYELEQILALPTGFKYRHRYDERWVDTSLRTNVAGVVGKEVLIVFWNTETKKLLPLRWGTVENAQTVGRIHYFEYRLGDFVAFKSDPAQRNSQILAFNETFQGFHSDVIGQGETGFRASVLTSDAGQTLQRAEYDNLTNWGNVLDEVAKASVFRGFEFLKIIDIRDGVHKVIPQNGVYELRNNKTYTLRVFQIIAAPLDAKIQPHDIDLNAFADQLQILRRRQTAVGKYDILTFVFRPVHLAASDQTPLELVPVHDGRLPQVQFQRLYIPVRMRTDKAESVLRGFGLITGILLVFVPLYFGLREPLPGFLGLMLFMLSLSGADGIRSIVEPFLGHKT